MKNVILIPGIFGCSMQDSQGREIWPPGQTSDPISTDELVQLLLDPATVPIDLIRQCDGPIYGPVIDMLKALPDVALTPVPYDWRKDIRDAAATLGAKLDALGNTDPIVIVAHSMGGLVARWLLESGTYNALPWFPRVAALICVAVPHLGAPAAFFELKGTINFNPIFLPGWATKALDSDPKTFPSGYQLLPPADVECVSQDQKPTDSIPDAFKDQLVADGLAALAEIHDLLDKFSRPAAINYYLAYGSIGAANTITGITLDGRGQPQEGKGDGDGTVPVWSSVPFLLAASTIFKAKAMFMSDHVGILSNSAFQKQLASWLSQP